jgi:hypothetical protein
MRKKRSMTLASCFLREVRAKLVREREAEKRREEPSRKKSFVSQIAMQAKKRPSCSGMVAQRNE